MSISELKGKVVPIKLWTRIHEVESEALDQLIHAKTEGIDGIIKPNVKVNLVVTCMDQMDEYKLTYGGELITLTDKENFVKLIADALNVRGNLFMNNSPESNLKELK